MGVRKLLHVKYMKKVGKFPKKLSCWVGKGHLQDNSILTTDLIMYIGHFVALTKGYRSKRRLLKKLLTVVNFYHQLSC